MLLPLLMVSAMSSSSQAIADGTRVVGNGLRPQFEVLIDANIVFQKSTIPSKVIGLS